MWEVGRMMCLGALAGLSVTDIFWRKIPAEFFVMGTAGVLCAAGGRRCRGSGIPPAQ